MSTALEQMHEIEPHVRIARARAGVLMLILSDSLSVVAILAAGGYLNSLNTTGQFTISGDHGPAFLPSLLVAIILVLSGLFYYWWERRVRSTTGGTGSQALFILACALMVVALVVQIWISAILKFDAPLHAYESLILLLAWYAAVHLLLTAIVGVLLLGRVLRGRVAEHNYIAEVVGYWWYYTVIASLLMWLFSAFFK